MIDELTVASMINSESSTGGSYALGKIEKALFLEEISSGMYMAFSLQTSDIIVEKCRDVLNKMKQEGLFQYILKGYGLE